MTRPRPDERDRPDRCRTGKRLPPLNWTRSPDPSPEPPDIQPNPPVSTPPTIRAEQADLQWVYLQTEPWSGYLEIVVSPARAARRGVTLAPRNQGRVRVHTTPAVATASAATSAVPQSGV